jgi:hypothetical protein
VPSMSSESKGHCMRSFPRMLRPDRSSLAPNGGGKFMSGGFVCRSKLCFHVPMSSVILFDLVLKWSTHHETGALTTNPVEPLPPGVSPVLCYSNYRETSVTVIQVFCERDFINSLYNKKLRSILCLTEWSTHLDFWRTHHDQVEPRTLPVFLNRRLSK